MNNSLISIDIENSQGPYTVLIDTYEYFTWDVQDVSDIFHTWLNSNQPGTFLIYNKNVVELKCYYMFYPNLISKLKVRFSLHIVRYMYRRKLTTTISKLNVLNYINSKH